MDQAAISSFISSKVLESKSSMLNKIDNLFSTKLNVFQKQISENHRNLSESQVARIEQLSQTSYTFNKTGNEEQHKANAKVAQKLYEPKDLLQDNFEGSIADELNTKISEGIDVKNHRQKLIKLADSSQYG
ncbi:hypothetical protein SNE40_019772 [Patella caerulea]|uniref:Uncharacterized protein n=1 Tax=Patella caerulea TaxID=87958 RepID=A0AAN8JA11_PATCE